MRKPASAWAYEKRVIREMGFVSYFLIVWDLIRWARDNDIPVGPGARLGRRIDRRLLLDITRVCPLKYDLLFERFLNSARVSMPDIDIDFCKEGRERVLSTRASATARRTSRRSARSGRWPRGPSFATSGECSTFRCSDVDRIAKMIPSGPGAPPLAVKAVEKDKDLAELREQNPDRSAELFNFSIKLEGMARHISTHAAGVVIADKPIDGATSRCAQTTATSSRSGRAAARGRSGC